MKIFQHTIERLLYLLLFLVFAVSIVAAVAATYDAQRLKRQEIQFHKDSVASQKTIISNQDRLDVDLRNSIKCLFALNPQTATAQLAQACFNVETNK